MKLDKQPLERFLKDPAPNIAAALIFGPDEGMVHERALAVSRAILGDADDPFRLTELTGDDIKADPARLIDEARANGSVLPVAALVDQFYADVQAMGEGGVVTGEQVLNQIRHGGIVAVQGALGDARRLGEVAHRGLRNPLLHEQFQCGRQNPAFGPA